MTETWRKLGLAAVAGATGLVLILVGTERSTLAVADAARKGIESRPSGSVLVLFVLGVMLLSFSAFGALTVWSRRLRTHPGTRQVPAWVLLLIVVVTGVFALTEFARHTAKINALAVVPQEVDWGFIALQGLLGTVVIGALVALGVKWTPGRQTPRVRR